MLNKIEKIFNYEGISKEEIPRIPLYMDQLIGFFDDSMDVFKRDSDDKILTKTMVNNYVKVKVIDPPIKKKYSREQLMMLAMIYQMKNVLSINDLKMFFDQKRDGSSLQDIDSLYDRFTEIETEQIKTLGETYDFMLQDDYDKNKMIDSILNLIIEANLKKRLAEMLIDNLIQDDKE